MDDTKRCPKCGEVKPVGGFFRDKKSKDGLQCYCRSCAMAYSKAWYTTERRRAHKLSSRYGITTHVYNEVLTSQYRRCKICGKHEDDEAKQLHVDHDHVTGKIRGLLCHSCNIAIGHLGESPETALRTYEYLTLNGEGVDAVLATLEGEADGKPSGPMLTG